VPGKKDLLIYELRHHLTTILAWMDLPDRSQRMTAEAACAARECRRTLKITPDEIARRKHYLGVPEEEC
jgi:hypothetical protein